MTAGGNKSKYQNNESTRELGLTREVMNSLALFIYNRVSSPVPNTVKIFNEWASETGTRFERADEVCAVLEHIRKLLKVNRSDLGRAISMDGLFTTVEGINHDAESGDFGYIFTD